MSAIVDIARSLSASSLALTSLLKGWSFVSPISLQAVQTFFQNNLPTFLSDQAFNALLNLPAAAVFAAMAVIFYTIGSKREKPFGQIGLG